jgi:hypothetical protein
MYKSLEEELRDIELPQDLDSSRNTKLLREMQELLCQRRPSRQEGFQDEK